MDEKNVVEILKDSLELSSMEDFEDIISRIASFSEAGLLTNDDGLVLYLNDGSEFQITVLRRK